MKYVVLIPIYNDRELLKLLIENINHEIKDLNHEISIVTGVPNFPKGKVFNGYKNKIFQSENLDGINIYRVWTFIAANRGFIFRILDYISFMFTSFLAGLFLKKYDVIIATSPQFFTAISGWLISFFRKLDPEDNKKVSEILFSS